MKEKHLSEDILNDSEWRQSRVAAPRKQHDEKARSIGPVVRRPDLILGRYVCTPVTWIYKCKKRTSGNWVFIMTATPLP